MKKTILGLCCFLFLIILNETLNYRIAAVTLWATTVSFVWTGTLWTLMMDSVKCVRVARKV